MSEMTQNFQFLARRTVVAWLPPVTWPTIEVGTEHNLCGISNVRPITSSPHWRLWLRDDSYTDRKLSLLTNGRVRARLAPSIPAPEPPSVLRALASDIPTCSELDLGFACDLFGKATRHCVQVVMEDLDGDPLMYCAAWWDSRVYNWLAVDNGLALPGALGQREYEHSRRMISAVYGECNALEDPSSSGTPANVWGRNYVYKRRRTPICVVHEVFAPAMQKYLGKSTPPL